MTLDDFERLVHRRRSVFPRQFQEEELPREELIRILELANRAPTHMRTEPWRFRILRGEARARLGHFLAERYRATTDTKRFLQKKYDQTLHKPSRCAAIIAICMQRDPKMRIPEWEEVAAVASAVQNLWLGATAMGWGGYWSTPKGITEDREFLGLGDSERCLGLFYLGRPQESTPVTPRGAIEEKLTWIDT